MLDIEPRSSDTADKYSPLSHNHQPLVCLFLNDEAPALVSVFTESDDIKTQKLSLLPLPPVPPISNDCFFSKPFSPDVL